MPRTPLELAQDFRHLELVQLIQDIHQQQQLSILAAERKACRQQKQHLRHLEKMLAAAQEKDRVRKAEEKRNRQRAKALALEQQLKAAERARLERSRIESQERIAAIKRAKEARC